MRSSSHRPRWLGQLAAGAYAVWRTLHRQAQPLEDPSAAAENTPSLRALQQLPRAMRRTLRHTGIVGRTEVPVAARAAVAARDILASLRNHQVVLWLDNFCWLRWGTD
eukprot:EG_transcript_36079